MQNSIAISLVLFGAIVFANIPFLTRKLFGLIAIPNKSFAVRVLELVIFYFLMGGLARLLEKDAGQITPQRWEFYAITATLFVTFAFPGFVYRYLLKHTHA